MLTRRAGMHRRQDRSSPGDARPCSVTRLFFDDCDEAIAPSMHRLNEVLVLAAITQCATRRPQTLSEGGFTHGLVRSELGEQFFLGDHTIAMLHEVDQHIEPLGFQRAQPTPPAEFIALRIELVICKDIDHFPAPPHSGEIHRTTAPTPHGAPGAAPRNIYSITPPGCRKLSCGSHAIVTALSRLATSPTAMLSAHTGHNRYTWTHASDSQGILAAERPEHAHSDRDRDRLGGSCPAARD